MFEGSPTPQKNERDVLHERVQEMIEKKGGSRRAWKAVVFAAMLGVANVSGQPAQAHEITLDQMQTLKTAPLKEVSPMPPMRNPAFSEAAVPTREKKDDRLIIEQTPPQQVETAPVSMEQLIEKQERETYIQKFMEALEKEQGLSLLVLKSWDLEVQLDFAQGFLSEIKKRGGDPTNAEEVSSALTNLTLLQEVISVKYMRGIPQRDMDRMYNQVLKVVVKNTA